MIKIFRDLLFILVIAGLISSCKSDDPEPEEDQELITDVVLHFQEVDANNNPLPGVEPLVFTASDAEGLSLGGSPSIDLIALKEGKKYVLRLEIKNSIAGEDITEEIEEEAALHQFFFLGSVFSNNLLTYGYSDDDTDGHPLGLEGIVSTDAVGTGTLRVILRHALDKSTPGADNPNWTNYTQAGGESDLDLTFNVTIE